MSISEVLLFIATNSRACIPCLEFKDRHRFPAQVIRLDSEESRAAVANGKYFQVTSVPSMVVIYDDGNTQMFVGAPKIIQWITMIIKSERSEDSTERGVTSYLPAGGNMYGPRPNPPKSRYPEEFQPEPKRRVFVEEDEPEEPSRHIVEEEEPEEEPRVKAPPKNKKKSKPAPAKKTSKKKKPPVQFEEQEIEVEYIEPEDEPPKKRTKPMEKRQPSRMNGIYNVAKQMEQDRQSSLGYKEEDLPHYQ